MEWEILEKEMYPETKKGISMFGGDIVTIIGEQTVRLKNGEVIEQYLYDIDGYTAENGKAFVGLKSNISLN